MSKEKYIKDEIKEGILPWDSYFMSLALASAYRSKDPSTKVGAVIVGDDRYILSIGYNGMPHGLDDLPWSREGDSNYEKKYDYVVHAEMNALANANKDVRGAKIYTTLFPCAACSKLMAQHGISEVVYLYDFYKEDEQFKISRRILDHTGIKYRQSDHVEVKITDSHGTYDQIKNKG